MIEEVARLEIEGISALIAAAPNRLIGVDHNGLLQWFEVLE